MSFFWNVFERVSDTVGQDGALVCFAVVVGVLAYLILGSPNPSSR
jgi:hypothetical protein